MEEADEIRSAAFTAAERRIVDELGVSPEIAAVAVSLAMASLAHSMSPSWALSLAKSDKSLTLLQQERTAA
ncbi:MAG: hypothetical protein ABIQ65_20720 [Thermoanaerobaculia bacterium]